MNRRSGLGRRPMMGVFTGGFLACMMGTASGMEIRWQPISASGSSFTIIDNEATEGTPSEIIVDAGGADVVVTLEIHCSGWGVATGNPPLGAYQGSIIPSDYDNGVGDPLNPFGWPADPPSGAFIDSGRSDFVFFGLSPVPAVSTSTLEYEYGATQLANGAEDGGEIYYGGTLLLEIPANAAGTYELGWDPSDIKTFFNDMNAKKIPGLFRTPVLITVPEQCGMDDIVQVDPPLCAIDARQPHALNNAGDAFGWRALVLTFGCDPAGMNLQPADFGVLMDPFSVAPFISSVVTDGVNQTVTITLDRSIEPGYWTCITHPDSGNRWCMGYLPGDVDQSRKSTSADIVALINSLNGGGASPDYAVDVNRSGAVNAQDLLRVIDLLNGSNAFTAWLNAELPECPE